MSAFFICAGCGMHVPDDQEATHWCPKRLEIARKPFAERVVATAMAMYAALEADPALADSDFDARGFDFRAACRSLEEFEKKHGAERR